MTAAFTTSIEDRYVEDYVVKAMNMLKARGQ